MGESAYPPAEQYHQNTCYKLQTVIFHFVFSIPVTMSVSLVRRKYTQLVEITP